MQSVTFEVDSAVPIHIGLPDNLGDLPGRQLLAQQPPHGLLQLAQGDLPVAVGVKLNRGRRGRCSGPSNDAAARGADPLRSQKLSCDFGLPPNSSATSLLLTASLADNTHQSINTVESFLWNIQRVFCAAFSQQSGLRKEDGCGGFFKLSQISKNFSNINIEEKSHISGLALFELMLFKGQLY